MAQMFKPIPINPELAALLEAARKLPPMTAEQMSAQRRSWVTGEMMLSNLDLTKEQANEIYDDLVARGITT